jgi:hypothetical protein
MRKTAIVLLIVVPWLVTVACDRATPVEDIPPGTQVAVTTKDGTVVRGSLTAVSPDTLVLEQGNAGRHQTIERAAVDAVVQTDANDDFLDVTVPAGTTLAVALEGPLASNANAVEDSVHATTRTPVVVDGVQAIPAGSRLSGSVTNATPSGAVKGRARLAFAFDEITVDGASYDIKTKPVVYQAEDTRKEDAVKIGAGAAAGGIIGGLAGGKKGAAIGAAVGGGAGTAVVLATPGDEVRLASGTGVSVELISPATITVRKPDPGSPSKD